MDCWTDLPSYRCLPSEPETARALRHNQGAGRARASAPRPTPLAIRYIFRTACYKTEMPGRLPWLGPLAGRDPGGAPIPGSCEWPTFNIDGKVTLVCPFSISIKALFLFSHLSLLWLQRIEEHAYPHLSARTRAKMQTTYLDTGCEDLPFVCPAPCPSADMILAVRRCCKPI